MQYPTHKYTGRSRMILYLQYVGHQLRVEGRVRRAVCRGLPGDGKLGDLSTGKTLGVVGHALEVRVLEKNGWTQIINGEK